MLLLIGYLPALIDFYYKQVFSSKITTIETTEPRTICSSGSKKCIKEYNFLIPGLMQKQMSLVVGKIWTASEWRCGTKMLFQTGDVKFLSTSRTTLNEFFVIDSALLSSCQTGRINVKVHYPSSQKKAGLMERYLHLTDSSTAYKLRSAHEFVIKDYKILNLSVMLLVLLFTYLIQIVSLDKSSELRLVMSLFLTFGAIAQSCITEIFLPFEVVSIANRWIAMISYCSYLAFASDYLEFP